MTTVAPYGSQPIILPGYPNAVIYTYVAGSSTPQVSYSSMLSGNLAGPANTNPIVALPDSNNDGTYYLFLDTTLAYRIVTFDQYGNLISDVDNQTVAEGGSSSGDAVLVTGNQTINGIKIFAGQAAFGSGNFTEYATSPYDIIVGAQATANTVLQLVGSNTESIYFGTVEAGSNSSLGRITYTNGTNEMTFFVNNAQVLALTSSQMSFAGNIYQNVFNQVLDVTSTITLTGAVTGTGTSAGITTTIAPSGATPGSYINSDITVNAAGQITAVSSGAGGTLIAYTPTDQTITAFNYDPYLVVTLAANSYYKFEIYTYMSSFSSLVNLQPTYTGTVQSASCFVFQCASGAGPGAFPDGGFTTINNAVLTPNTNGVSLGSGSSHAIFITEGFIVTNTGGTFQMKWGPNSAVNCTMKQGSYMRVELLS